MTKTKKSLPWYQGGLPFSCTECGKCCTGSPGYVWVSEQEIEDIAQTLDLSVNEVHQRYTRYCHGRYSLRETRRGKNYDCIFLDGKRCTIYNARPTQCRTYPWWPQNLDSEESWERTRAECEGIHPEAQMIPLEKIQKGLDAYVKGTSAPEQPSSDD